MLSDGSRRVTTSISMASILDYNNFLNNPTAQGYNNVLNEFGLSQPAPTPPPYTPNYRSPAAIANTASTATGGSTNPLADFQSILDSLNGNTNNYFGQQQGFYNTENQLQNALYGAQNTNLLGTQGADASNAFLNSIEDPLLKQEGQYQYGYGLNSGHTNNVYGLNSTANKQNRDLALNKLSNDENWALANLGLSQGNQNASTIDSLNQRGLLYGQSPTGAYQPTAMGGMSGLAAQQAGRVNEGFGNQRGQLTSTYGLNQQGINQDYTQQQNMLDENHNYDLKNLAMGTVGNINNQNAQNTYNVGMANNQLAQYKASLNNQQQQQLNNNTQTAYTKALLKNNAYTGQ